LNRKHLAELDTPATKIFSTIQYLLDSRFANSITNAISNISAHYDLSNDMFASFLSRDMTYSCAIFDPPNSNPGISRASSLDSMATAVGPTSESQLFGKIYDDPLEAAQMRKLHRILELARIRPGDKVLEIGTGWGSLAIEAVRS
jgi:cyclopropane-fatty-acyl-phospholipid synthase